MSDKIYVVYKEGETDPMSVFLAEVIYAHDTSAMVQIWERGSHPHDSKYTIDSPVERDDFKEAILTVEKKFSGCVEVKLSGHWCGSVPGEELGLMLNTAAFFCDQEMALERSDEYGMYDSFEEALESLNCGDGADENPGIVYRNLADEGKFIPTPMKTTRIPMGDFYIEIYEEDK